MLIFRWFITRPSTVWTQRRHVNRLCLTPDTLCMPQIKMCSRSECPRPKIIVSFCILIAIHYTHKVVAFRFMGLLKFHRNSNGNALEPIDSVALETIRWYRHKQHQSSWWTRQERWAEGKEQAIIVRFVVSLFCLLHKRQSNQRTTPPVNWTSHDGWKPIRTEVLACEHCQGTRSWRTPRGMATFVWF